MDYKILTKKKAMLDKHRPLSDVLVRNLADWFRIELTYTSNAIEGNTLTRQETALVVEKGLAVGNKSLIEHLEATHHAAALDWVKSQIERKPQQITAKDVLLIHDMILRGIDDVNAGCYRNVPVRIAGSTVVLPNPRKVPVLMDAFFEWLQCSVQLHPVELAAEAHYRLVTIHPFTDGNGRTARLLMNMILLMTGYPSAIIRKRDRLVYINALERAQLGGSRQAYDALIMKAVDRSLDIYLKAVQGESVDQADELKLLKISELAQQVNEPISTVRYWVKQGLLEATEITQAGYRLYSPELVIRIEKIKALKAERYTLDEIKAKLV